MFIKKHFYLINMKSTQQLIVTIISMIALYLLSSAIFMLIWNDVLIHKIPRLDLQVLNFQDAMAMVFLIGMISVKLVINQLHY